MMAGVPTYNYETEQAAIARKQKIADAMMSGQLLPNQQMSHPGGQRSWLEALLPAAQAMLGNHMSKGVEAKQAGLTERYNKDLQEGMNAFGQTAGTDRNKAIQDALASNHPVLREYAMKEAAKRAEGMVQPKDLVAISQPQSVLANQSDPSKWLPKEEIGEVGGMLYDKNTKNSIALNGPGPEQKEYKGDLYEKNASTGQWKKLDNAPKISVPVHLSNVNQAQRAGMGAFFTNAAKKVDELGTLAQTATGLKQSLAELENLDSQGIYSNVTSAPATYLANLAQVAGVPVDTKKLGNTESYNAIITDVWQGLVSKYGGNKGVTKDEATEIKKMLPLAASSPQARKQINQILGNVANRQIQQYEYANQSFAKAAQADNPSLFDMGVGVYTPQPNQPKPTTPKAPSKPSVSNW